MGKKYVGIKTYGEVLVPVELLEKLLDCGYTASTSYDSNLSDYVISDIQSIKEVRVYDEDDIQTALAQKALEGRG
jgi:hypothetical protein